MQTVLDSRRGHSYKDNIQFEDLEWCSDDDSYRITSRQLVFQKRYFVYNEGYWVHTAYDLQGAIDYAIQKAL